MTIRAVRSSLIALAFVALAGCAQTRRLVSRVPEAVASARAVVESVCADPELAKSKECKRARAALAEAVALTPEIMGILEELQAAIEAAQKAK